MRMTKYHQIAIKDSDIVILHADSLNFNIEYIEEKYKAHYIGEFCLKGVSGEWVNQPVALFYNEEKHPRGSNYFAILNKYRYPNIDSPTVMITNGISAVEDKEGNPIVYSAVLNNDNKALYSAYRHDYQTYEDLMIDGGRDYTKSSLGSPFIRFIIKDGKVELHD